MERQWWQDKVCYQIWPKSFQDSNGDGVGDIPGIIDRLDYLKELGVDILWLSPVYKSPLADEGYDIADYRGIDPRFGTMEDMERLLAETKLRGMYVVMDLVVNHCSDEHPWFQKALADPEGPYGKYFYFLKGKNGAPPTNWRSYFGGSVWSRVPGRDDLYYLHLFCDKQPDLDWENPAVRREVVEMVNWWLDKGVAGFRVDAIVNIGKPAALEDYASDRPDGLADCRQMLADPVARQRLHGYLAQLRDEAFAPHNAFTVGEVFDTDPTELALFIGQNGFFSSMFDFAAACWGGSPKGWYDAKKPGPDNYRDCVFESALRAAGVGFLSNIIENHDEPRGASRYLPEAVSGDPRAQKTLAAVQMLLPGLPFLYQGQEIGMTNTVFPSIDAVDDVNTRGEYAAALAAGFPPDEALARVARWSRDNARTPVQWTAGHAAGFTAGTPWMAVNPNYARVNVEAQQRVEGSVLEFYKSLIQLRKNDKYKEALVWGEFEPVLQEQPGLAAFVRTGGGRRLLIASNLSGEVQRVELPGAAKEVLLCSDGTPGLAGNVLTLAPWQAAVVELA
ncbi:alpha-glucosidase [Candidatus Allofournierella merdipullorum]|uniref:alpha-glucosidase n=1 Tax=Candidatus Allofournierella merdipullorum TaxID=2838595 RepID=UPI003AB84052